MTRPGNEAEAALASLRAVLAGLGSPRIAVAVSGGIDSLCLAAVAAPLLGDRLALHHATSPAVPPEATARTVALAGEWRERWGTGLVVFDAGEFADAQYRANPVDRCFFCKTRLYGTIAERLSGTGTLVLSGTNTDDLGDYRPGLRAAEAHGVRHPFVEAGISKPVLRRIAPLVGLAELAELPSAPCLSSRIETGIRIEPGALALVHAAERLVSDALSPATVRCRVRRDGLVVELDEHSLSRLPAAEEAALRAGIERAAATAGEPVRPVRFAPYRTGSAFLRPGTGAGARPGYEPARSPGPEVTLHPERQAVLLPEPQAVLLSEPQAVLLPQPQAVLLPEPKAVSGSEPQSVSFPELQAVASLEPQAGSCPKPQAISFPEPRAVSFPDPQAVVRQRPELVPTSGPGTTGAARPEPGTVRA